MLQARDLTQGQDIPVLSLKGLSKTFPGGQRALHDAHLDVLPGEIHGLLGQNGSGKSTLIKVLAGFYAPDPGGELLINGSRVSLPLAPGQFRRLGMSFVHQNLALANTLSVLDNLRVGRYRTGPMWKIEWRHESERVAQALDPFGLHLDPETQVSELSESQRAIVAIARALQEIENRESGVLVLDEPTAYLSGGALQTLFEAMRKVARSGTSILFVTHRLEEVLEVTERVTVLRDGAVAGVARTTDVDEGDLIEMIIGRRMTDFYPAAPSPSHDTVMSLRQMSGGFAEQISFELKQGEVLGLTGLIGSGFEEVPYLIMGTRAATAGELQLGGKPVRLADLTVRDRIDLGIGLVPANRTRDGGVASLTVLENVTLPTISKYFRRLLLDHREERQDVGRLLQEFEVRPPDPDKIFGTLSGGNQQKAVLAKWLATGPKVLILHEPTQGVDVGARKQIFRQIRDATAQGCSIVLASLEYEDLAHLCDRVLVFRNGRIVSELADENLTEDRIVEQCYRGELTAAPMQPKA
jgi:ribose transport system ATP-binding protein